VSTAFLGGADLARSTVGLLLLFASIMCSCLSAVFQERVAKIDLESQPAHIQNMQLYLIGIATYGSIFTYEHATAAGESAPGGLLQGFSPVVWAMVAIHSLQGLFTGLSLRYGSAMVKTLALPVALVATTVSSIALGYPSRTAEVSPHSALAATICVVSGVLLYSIGARSGTLL
jgi:hypothetical protein